MTAALRRTLERDLAERLDRAQPDLVLLTLHIGCGAYALGISGRVEPLHHETEESTGTCARVEDLAVDVNDDAI